MKYYEGIFLAIAILISGMVASAVFNIGYERHPAAMDDMCPYDTEIPVSVNSDHLQEIYEHHDSDGRWYDEEYSVCRNHNPIGNGVARVYYAENKTVCFNSD